MARFISTVIARSDANCYLGTGSDGDFCVFTLDGFAEDLDVGDRVRSDFDGDEGSATWATNLTKEIEVYLHYESWGCTKQQALELLLRLGNPTHIYT
jgi:hypothetical protein